MTKQKPILATGPAGARQLAADLRKPMPKDFVFDFREFLMYAEDDIEGFREEYGRDCGYAGCAIGFVEVSYANGIGVGCDIGDYLGMNEKDESAIFFGGAAYIGLTSNGWGWQDITPEMVADALDDWAGKQETR